MQSNNFISGKHVVLDMVGVGTDILKDETLLVDLLKSACVYAGAEVIGVQSHNFDGEGGVTAVLLLSESHASVHTWPEEKFASFDFYTCGDSDPMKASDIIIEALRPAYHNVKLITRQMLKMSE